MIERKRGNEQMSRWYCTIGIYKRRMKVWISIAAAGRGKWWRGHSRGWEIFIRKVFCLNHPLVSLSLTHTNKTLHGVDHAGTHEQVIYPRTRKRDNYFFVHLTRTFRKPTNILKKSRRRKPVLRLLKKSVNYICIIVKAISGSSIQSTGPGEAS